MGFLGGIVVKNLPANAGDSGSVPGVGKIIWGRKWHNVKIFLWFSWFLNITFNLKVLRK